MTDWKWWILMSNRKKYFCRISQQHQPGYSAIYRRNGREFQHETKSWNLHRHAPHNWNRSWPRIWKRTALTNKSIANLYFKTLICMIKILIHLLLNEFVFQLFVTSWCQQPSFLGHILQMQLTIKQNCESFVSLLGFAWAR